MKVPGTRKEWETGGSNVWDLDGRPSVSLIVLVVLEAQSAGKHQKKNEKEISVIFG